MGKIRRTWRWLVADCWVSRFIRNPYVTWIATFSVGLYWKLIGPLADSYVFVRGHQDILRGLLPFLVGCVFILGVWRAAGDKYLQHDQSYAESLQKLLKAIDKIIIAKTKRFEARMSGYSVKESVFKRITHPVDQMKFILGEAVEFLAESSGVPNEKFSITVIQITGKRSGKMLASVHSDRKHTEIRKLLEVRSTAAICLETGDPKFLPDKKLAELSGIYFMSDRDSEHGGRGSLYCEPVDVPINGRKVSYLVTFSTYGHQICRAGDRSDEEAVKIYCCQFVRRIRLELTLHTIREYESRLRSKKLKPKRRMGR